VATIGRFDVFPDLVNVIAQRVTLTLDVRNTDDTLLRTAEAHMMEFAQAAANAEGCTLHTRSLARFEPVAFADSMIDTVERIAQGQGHSTLRLPSGAGHDAQMLARVCPTSMIFVPSVDGLSHNIAEFTEAADIAAGANVLLHMVLELAEPV
jgi:N-carbamoyl-L-amino-acid hydrolase